MPAPKLLVDRRDAVTLITVNRPEVHNAIDAETAGLLQEAVGGFAADPDARVLVVTGAGDRAFCSGADLTDIEALVHRPERGAPLGFSDLDPDKPSVAAVEGYCMGGGIELACWCDVRIAGEGAVFGALNRRVGVPWIDGGTQRLTRTVGVGNALYLMETGEPVDAARAREMGLVQEVTPAGEALPRALELAARIAAYPQRSLLGDRRAAVATLGLPLADGLGLEAKEGGAAAADPELADAVRKFRAERGR